MARCHGINLAIYLYLLFLVVYVFEESALVHLPFGVLGNELTLYLKLDDSNGFVHLSCQSLGFLVYVSSATAHLGYKLSTFVVLVCFHGKSGQGDKVDAIAFL